MFYSILSLGAATLVLGLLLIRSYTTLGKYKKETKVQHLLIEDLKYELSEYKKLVRKNEKIDKEPLSSSISDALSGLSKG